MTAEAPTTEDRATDLLGRLFALIHESHCDFKNGVEYQGVDEGQVYADRFLDEVQEFLADHGDVYASELRAYRRSLTEEIANAYYVADGDKLPF